jgi:hypothetical protein
MVQGISPPGWHFVMSSVLRTPPGRLFDHSTARQGQLPNDR